MYLFLGDVIMSLSIDLEPFSQSVVYITFLCSPSYVV